MTEQDFFNRYTYNVQTNNIGGGSFGTVYKAYDNILDREVAIKVSEVKHVGNKEFSLLEEYNAIKNLPINMHIANYEGVYRFVDRNGTYDYAIMQYYPLGNLSAYIKNNEVSLADREKLVLGILEGIAFLHQHKVVHRDLKPSNILVVNRNGELIPKITDFGLSKQANTDAKGSRFTNSFAGGTLQYSSPEQLKGLPLKLNTDLWSFGVIAYEILTGKTLFEAQSNSTASAEWQNEITQKILHHDVTPALQVLPDNWKNIVTLCLERDINKRAQNTDSLFVLLNNKVASQEKTVKPVIAINEDTQIKEITKRNNLAKEKPNTTKPLSKKNKPKWLVPVIVGVLVLFLGLIGYNGLISSSSQPNLELFKQNNLYGYKLGDSVVIKPQYTNAKSFKDDIAKVSTADSTFYIDLTGKWVLSYISEEGNNGSIISNNDNTEEESLIESQEADRLDWNKAKRKNTRLAYQNYLNHNLEGDFRKQAQQAITNLDKAKATTKKQDRLAEAKKEDQLAWNKAKNKNTKVAYQKYLDHYPSGNYRSNAQQEINKINQALAIEEKRKGEDREDIIDVPYAIIENVPVYPGCTGSNSELKNCMSNKISQHIGKKFNTDLASDLGLTGRQRIIVQFKIDRTGNVVGVKARAPHPKLEEEAIRVIKALPKMVPGKQRGKAVGVLYSLPIVFSVEK